jgi:hypothetical protein
MKNERSVTRIRSDSKVTVVTTKELANLRYNRRDFTQVLGFFMRKLIIIAALSIAFCAAAFARDTAVVVAKGNTTKTLALADLTKMVKTTKKWADGKPAMFILRDPSAPEMKTAISKVFGMTADEVKTLIAENKQSFVIVPTDADVVKAVQVNPNAIGLTDVYSITSGVNVLKLDGKMPLEPGYALHGQ